MDHVVVVLFENRSLDNMLGRLYGPEDGKTFEGVVGKGLSNPIPEWAEDGAERRVVPYTVATAMDSPNPDSGEEYPQPTRSCSASWTSTTGSRSGRTSPSRSTRPSLGRRPTYLRGVREDHDGLYARAGPRAERAGARFGVFDRWFCEVPSQTLPNRSFWTAATSSGFSVNHPAGNFVKDNTAETIFNRLDDRGKTWKIYVAEPQRMSGTALVHFQRLKDRLATNVVPFAEFETDAASGSLPDFAFIEPCLTLGHADYHPACGRALGHGVVIQSVDPPSSILGGEAFLSRIYDVYNSMRSETGANVWNTTLLIGWDEPGGTYDHVPPPAAAPPDASAPAGQHGFTFDRSGYRVPAIIVSPWIAEATVFNEEYRHTSLLATLREKWNLGDAFTARDAAARTFSHVFTLDTPRDPGTWPNPTARPVPKFTLDVLALGTVIFNLGRHLLDMVRSYAQQHEVKLDNVPEDPNAEIPPENVVSVLQSSMALVFPKLAPAAPGEHR